MRRTTYAYDKHVSMVYYFSTVTLDLTLTSLWGMKQTLDKPLEDKPSLEK